MARKNSRKQPDFSTRFVRYNLTAEDKKAIPAYQKSHNNELDNLVNEVLGANHKISFSFNESNDQYICSVTGKPEDCVNASLCYTSFAKTWSGALWVALYKYHVVWEAVAWADLDETEDFG